MAPDDNTDQTITVVSYNRPLTRQARDTLKEHGIVSEESVREPGRQTVVEVEERPSESVLERHELSVDEEPLRVYEADMGSTVRIYPTKVMDNGVETSLDPEDAITHAEEAGWERVDG